MRRSAARPHRCRRSPAVLRRLERRAAQAPDLVDPSLAALNTALVALEEAGEALAAADARRRILIRASRSASRSGSSRCVRPAANTTCRSRAAGAGRDAWRRTLPRSTRARSSLAEARAELRRPAGRLSQAARRRSLRGAQGRGGPARRRGEGRAAAARSSSARASSPTSRATSTARAPGGFDRVEFCGRRTNPGTRPGPMMKVASGGELSRFMLALKVGAGRARFGPDAGLRRDRYGRGRRGSRCDRRAAWQRLAGTRPGDFGDPCAAGRGQGRAAFPDREIGR